ncbi:MAG: 1,4-alpha-glucan branching protein GlgB [Burkholderiaceae bacterium]
MTASPPARATNLISELDRHLFCEGRHYELYRLLGAHPITIDGVGGVRFVVWAPNASHVNVIGSFNQWQSGVSPMVSDGPSGLYACFVAGAVRGDLYKYEIFDRHGERLPLKADPVAMRAEHPPETASVVQGLCDYEWRDQDWMSSRPAAAELMSRPVSIYEVHLASWARVPDENNRYLSYVELAEQLIPYVVDRGFTHIELLPVSEYPFDGSWGYQPTGLFAPTIRHGVAEEFAAFVNACHQAGLGVLIDWVPGHFPTDAHGLARFDGTALYEHEDPRRGFHQDWNTLIYNYGRIEVRNFLVANALYWLDQFHIDGLRVDAVASMLYLDYSRKPGEWIPNSEGGRENLEAVEFLRELNLCTHRDFPGTMIVAEESTAWPGVSRPLELDGLGFTFKWNMGWMNDTLRYFQRDPVHRQHHQDELTFGLVYAYTENFVLPISHDEVVHGKGSMLDKMPGDRWQRFANLRAYYGLMWAHPGKKLLFMGNEFAQNREWTHDHSLDWHLLDDSEHQGIDRLITDLNQLYVTEPALHTLDHDPKGFQWLDTSDSKHSVISWIRLSDNGAFMVVVGNLTPAPRQPYRVGLPVGGHWKVILSTDASEYGGSGNSSETEITAEPIAWHGRQFSAELALPPLAAIILKPQ